MMNANQLFSEIFNGLETEAARKFWNGMNRESQNEFVKIAQDKDLATAIREVEELANEPMPTEE